jgi:hypothetical protein
LLLDAGLIPFYVFTAIMAHMHLDEELGTKGRWTTVFKSARDTNKILLTTWLVAVTAGGMHIASLFIDLYLVIIFRKISNMPPDMSPLDSQNSRKKSKKHKHKNSSITVTTETSLASEKRFSAMSGTTNGSYVSVPGSGQSSPRKNRDSQNEPLLPGQVSASRPTSFYHTRNNSSSAFSPHNPETARLSRADLPSQIQQTSNRNSMVDIQRQGRRSRANTRNSSRPNSMVVADAARFYAAHDDGLSQSPSPQRSPQRRSRHEQQLHDDNWFVVAGDSDAETGDLAEPYRRHGGSAVSAATPSTVSTSSRPTSAVVAGARQQHQHQPLGMHPPSPVPRANPSQHKLRSTPTRGSPAPHAGSPAPQSPAYGTPTRSGTKGRYYGDLKAAVEGVRATPPQSPGPRVNQVPEVDPNWYTYQNESPRVVSRTGVDLDDGADLGLLSGDLRGRDVSGKVAEEGRGGPGGWYYGNGLVQRKVSGVA